VACCLPQNGHRRVQKLGAGVRRPGCCPKALLLALALLLQRLGDLPLLSVGPLELLHELLEIASLRLLPEWPSGVAGKLSPPLPSPGELFRPLERHKGFSAGAILARGSSQGSQAPPMKPGGLFSGSCAGGLLVGPSDPSFTHSSRTSPAEREDGQKSPTSPKQMRLSRRQAHYLWACRLTAWLVTTGCRTLPLILAGMIMKASDDPDGRYRVRDEGQDDRDDVTA